MVRKLHVSMEKDGYQRMFFALANFDLTFSYILAGWEGSAHDGKAHNDAKAKDFPKLAQGQYNLGDTGNILYYKILYMNK